MFSATIPPWVKDIAREHMEQNFRVVDLAQDLKNKTARNVKHLAIDCPFHDRLDALAKTRKYKNIFDLINSLFLQSTVMEEEEEFLSSHQPRQMQTHFCYPTRSPKTLKPCTVTSLRTREKSHSRDSVNQSSRYSSPPTLLQEASIFQMWNWSSNLNHQKILNHTFIDPVELPEQASQELASPSSTEETVSSLTESSKWPVSRWKWSTFQVKTT